MAQDRELMLSRGLVNRQRGPCPVNEALLVFTMDRFSSTICTFGPDALALCSSRVGPYSTPR